MRTKRQITAALLLAAAAAAGCSTSDDTNQPRPSESQPAARVTPASVTSDLPALNTTPAVAGAVSFADGEAAYRAGKYSEATIMFEKYTAQKPDNAWGHFMLGLSAWKGGDLRKAETAFEDALRIDPEHLKSLLNLSRVQLEQRRFEDAFNNLSQASEIDANSAEVHRLLGRTYSGQGKSDEAVDEYRRAIELDDKDAWSMNNLGLLFLEQNRAHDALPLLARAVYLKKDAPAFHNNLGMALEHTGRFTAAAMAYNNALAADPNNEKARKNLARVQTVKVTSEESFDLEAMAGVVVQKQSASGETDQANPKQ